MWRLSRFGDRRGIDWLTYNVAVFAFFDELAKRCAPGVISAMKEAFPDARRWADVGAGSGRFAAVAQDLGVNVVACERSRRGRRIARRLGVDSRPFDLAGEAPASLPADRDLAYCFEVAEHVSMSFSDALVRFLTALAPVVVFTAAPPGQGGIGHVNERPREFWIEQFASAGATHCDEEASHLVERFEQHGVPMPWFYTNLMIFRR